jgi:hypothetical protein
MKFIKIICSAFIVAVLIFCSIGLIFQVRAEKYLHYTKNKHEIFLQKRIKYTPFIIFYIKGRIDSNFFKQYSKYIYCPYEEKGLENYLCNISYSTYFVYCFYTIEELKQMNCKSLMPRLA